MSLGMNSVQAVDASLRKSTMTDDLAVITGRNIDLAQRIRMQLYDNLGRITGEYTPQAGAESKRPEPVGQLPMLTVMQRDLGDILEQIAQDLSRLNNI